MTRVLVTGATGFVGGNLIKDLAGAKYEVVALVRRNSKHSQLAELGIELRYGDILDLRCLVEAFRHVDCVVHLAAMTSSVGVEYEKSFQVNVVGSQNVIDANKVNRVHRIIFVGTQSDNTGAYATTKREAEKLFRDCGLNVVTIKPSLIYGPGGGGLFGSMVKFISKSPVIPIVGSGKYPMKPIYVGDVTQVIISCMQRDNLKPEYLISGPKGVAYIDFMAAIAKAMGVRRIMVRVPYLLTFVGVSLVSTLSRNFPITPDTLRGLANPRVYESTEACEDLNFRPIPLEEGLNKTWAQTEVRR